MDFRLELVAVPVTDVDRAKSFYVDQVGFNADVDAQVNEELRFVQLTPSGSACSIVIGTGITEMAPGSQQGLQVVVADINAAREHLVGRGVETSEVETHDWGPSSTSPIRTATPGRCSSCLSAATTEPDALGRPS